MPTRARTKRNSQTPATRHRIDTGTGFADVAPTKPVERLSATRMSHSNNFSWPWIWFSSIFPEPSAIIWVTARGFAAIERLKWRQAPFNLQGNCRVGEIPTDQEVEIAY